MFQRMHYSTGLLVLALAVLLSGVTGTLADPPANLREEVEADPSVIDTDGKIDGEAVLVLRQAEYVSFEYDPAHNPGVWQGSVTQPGIGIGLLWTDVDQWGEQQDIDGFRDEALCNGDAPLPNDDDEMYPGDFCSSFYPWMLCDKRWPTSADGPLRSPFNTGQIIVVYLPDSDGDISTEDDDDSLLYVAMDIANGDFREVCNEPGGAKCRYLDVQMLEGTLGEAATPLNNGLPDYCDNVGGCQIPWDQTQPDGIVDWIMVSFDTDGDGATQEVVRFDIDGDGINDWEPPWHLVDVLTPPAETKKYGVKVYICGGFMALPLGDPFRGGMTTPLGQPNFTFMMSEGLTEDGTSYNQTVDVGATALAGVVIPEEDVDSCPEHGWPLSQIESRGMNTEPDDDVEFLVRHIDTRIDEFFPETSYDIDRLRLASGGMVTTVSDSDGDSAGEDTVRVEWFLPMPAIDVMKDVRCEGDAVWESSVPALPGSTVEFKIEVTNTGNERLYVTLTDVIETLCDGADVLPIFNAIKDGGNGIVDTTASGDDIQIYLPGEKVEPGAVIILPGPNCIPDSVVGGDDVMEAPSTTMNVTLYDDLGAEGVKAVPIDFTNADKGYCSENVNMVCENDPECSGFGVCVPLTLNPWFFGPADNLFLCDIVNGNETGLGTLSQVNVCDDPIVYGDRVVITFKGLVVATEDLCELCRDTAPDVTNKIKADAVMESDPDGIVVSAEDTIGIDVVCRDNDLTKKVRLLPTGAWVWEDTGIASIAAAGFPADVQYLVEFTNLGDITERVTLTEDSLCGDILTISVIVEPVAGDGIANTTASGNDVQVIAVGEPAGPGDVIILPGPDGALDTTPVSDDVASTGIGNISFINVIGEPVSGGNGFANTTADPLSDDIQVIDSGQPADPGNVIILPGPDGILDTTPATDDVVQQCDNGGLCDLPAHDDVPAGDTLVKTCTIRIANEAAALALCMADDGYETCSSDDGEADPKTYRNCVEARVEGVDLGDICDGPPIYDGSYAGVSRSTCELDVTKQVICLDNCVAQNTVGDWGDSLSVIHGTAMAFEISVLNTSETGIEPVCALEFRDLFPPGVELCANPGTTVQIINGEGDPVCTVPGDWFKGDGSEFELNLQVDCGVLMYPGDEVVVRVAAEVTGTAPFGDGVNHVDVTGAVSCPGGEAPAYSCTDVADADITVLEPALSCTKIYTQYKWDSDADCTIDDETWVDFSNPLTDLLDKVFPVVVKLEVTADNTTGEVPLTVTATDAELLADVAAAAGVTLGTCELGTSKLVPVGETRTWSCEIAFASAEAARQFALLDGGTDSCYDNEATVSGIPTTDGDICVPDPPGDPIVSTCQASICFPEPCELGEVVKDVKCWDDPDSAFASIAEALPGSKLTFRIRIPNLASSVKIPRICLTDALGCTDWLEGGSATAYVGGIDVTSCIGGDFEAALTSGNEVCFTFTGCTPLAGRPWIEPGETLELRFDVVVPTDDPPASCVNTVSLIKGYAEGCEPPISTPCTAVGDTATINVKVPEIMCEKTVCVDANDDGLCDDPPVVDLELLGSAVEPPFTLIYFFKATNTGATDLISVEICDLELVSDVAAQGGVTLGTCALDPVSGCASLSNLATPDGSDEVTCFIDIATRDAWRGFAKLDVGEDEDDAAYSNTARVTAVVDTSIICDYQADTDVDSECSASVSISWCEISVIKEVRCWDDCVEPTDPETGWVDDLEVVPGSCVEYRIIVENTSTVDLPAPACALKFKDLMDHKENFTTAGPQNIRVTGPSVCDWDGDDEFNWDDVEAVCHLVDAATPTVPRSLAPTEKLTVLFTAVLKGPDDISDDPEDSVNTVKVWGAADCPQEGPVWSCGPEEDSASLDIKECDITVTKEVKCTEYDDSTYGSDVNALPGTSLTFRIQVTNEGDANITKVCIKDELDCTSWLADSLPSLTATIGADDVLACMSGLEDEIRSDDDQPTCFEDWVACRPAAPHIAPDETLTITFEVTIPAEFGNVGSVEDCVNGVAVGAYAGVCSPEGPCAEGSASASINGLVPAVGCNKEVCADFDLNGNCNTWYSPNLMLSPSDFDYPIRLTYRFTAINPGEVNLKDVLICDDDFVFDVAAAPGITFVSCDLDLVSGCYDCGTLASTDPPIPDETCTAYCTIEVADQQAWETFAPYDGIHNCPPLEDPDRCYDNWVVVTGWVDVDDDPGICPDPDMGELSATCHARVAIQNICIPPPCPPVTKAMFDIWNQNEVKFSGTEKCISSWDEALLSQYSIVNHFLIENLQTNKGKARIQGVASDEVCGPDAESIDAPLLGVAVKMIDFDGTDNADIGDTDGMAGMSLVGMGSQEGQVIGSMTWMGAGSGTGDGAEGGPHEAIDVDATYMSANLQKDAPRDDGGRFRDDLLSRASTTQKGSLLVFPKVEVKWNSAGEIIQDTFLELTNDYPAGVEVQFFLVDGDMCVLLDNRIALTGNEPSYWSVATGMPKGVAPITALGPACPDPDADNPYGTRIRGYLVALAVSNWGQEIHWNHLKGGAVIMHYGLGTAWEYNAWAFKAVAGTHGSSLLSPPYVMDLDGVEYDAAPGMLLLDFYAPTAVLGSGEESHAIIDTDLTLWAAIKDMRYQP